MNSNVRANKRKRASSVETQTGLGEKRFAAAFGPIKKYQSDSKWTIHSLPTELVQKIFQYLDGHSLVWARLVCKDWARIIDTASYDTFPKVQYRAITVTAQRGFEVIFEKDVAEPYENNDRPACAPNRLSLKRTVIGSTVKYVDKPLLAELSSFTQYLRHIDTKKLTFQSLSNKGLTSMLHIFEHLCLGAVVLVFDFCNFSVIKKQLLLEFLKPRRGKLTEVQLSSCRQMEDNFTPEEFWEGLGGLTGLFPTVRLKDHYSNSPWMDQLAELILRSSNPPWMLDLDGVNPAPEAVFDRLRAWLASGPDSSHVLLNNYDNDLKQEDILKVSNAAVKSGNESGTSNAQASPLTGCSSSQRNVKDGILESGRLGRRNVVIKIDNCRGIRLGRFWNELVRSVLQPNDVKAIPKLCKVLEQCFDGRGRYSAHRNRMIIEESDGARFVVYLQR